MRELAKRLEQEKAPKFSVDSFCFDKQKEFLRSPGRFKVACTSTRAGKSNAIIAHMIETCISERDVVVAYFTISANSARNIIWGELKRILEDYNIPCDVNETTMRVKFRDTRSEIRINGANNESEIEKVRGWKLRAAYVDECFHGDTLVETAKGLVPIRDIQIGDEVKSAIGFQKVVSLDRKQKNKFVKLNYNGKIVKSSENHPFFTTRGWINASELKIGDYLVTTNTAMSMLSEGFCASSKVEEILLRSLRQEVSLPENEVQKSIQRSMCALQGGVYKASGQGVPILQPVLQCEASEDDIKPYAQSRNCGEGKDRAKIHRPCAKNSWRQWGWADQGRADIASTFARTYLELPGKDGQRKENTGVSDVLQVGPSLSSSEAGNRSGWQQSWHEGEKTSGYKENRIPSIIRLDDIEILECRDDDTNPEGYFYDIGVEGHPSFTVNGVLVHNCQSFRGYLKYFIESILMSRLRDQAGTLILTGTPGPVPSGFFYDVYHNQNSWSKFHWTCFDNPHMRNLEQVLAEERAAAGITEEDPSYQREVYGRWVQDTNSLVFQFNSAINITTTIPDKLEYIFGVDFGYKDSDAISVIGYNSTNVYLVEEMIVAKQSISDLAEQIKLFQDRYKPTKIVYDGGALGLKIGVELQQRHGLHMVPAEKDRKIEFIELLNDDLRSGRFKALPNSRFQEDCALVLWDKESSGGKRRISDSYHSDINDAVLYSWREAKHYLQMPASNEKPEIRSLEQLNEQIAKESAEVDAAKRGDLLDDNVDEQDLMSIFDIYGSDF